MDTDLLNVYNYLKDSLYPSNAFKDDKRKIRSRSKAYSVKNDKLYSGQTKRKNLSFEERRKILEGKHDENGHFGREKTLWAISDRYFGKNICDDVDDYVKCQEGGAFQKCDVKLHPISIIHPRHHLGMDLITMPTSSSVNRKWTISRNGQKQLPYQTNEQRQWLLNCCKFAHENGCPYPVLKRPGERICKYSYEKPDR
jgi:hypothetical protein